MELAALEFLDLVEFLPESNLFLDLKEFLEQVDCYLLKITF